MKVVQERLQEFLQWSKRREIWQLGGDWKLWFHRQRRTDQETLRQQWAELSPAEVRKFVQWLAQELTPDGLYIAFPRLLEAFQDPMVGLAAHEGELRRVFDQCLKQHRVVPWEDRAGVRGIFVGPGEGKAEDVKPVRAFIVGGQGRKGPPKVYAIDFMPDERCEDALNHAAQACLSLFAWWRMALVLIWCLFGNHVGHWHTLFAGLRCTRRWSREVLDGCEIYLQVEQADSGIEGPSIFGSAFVAILLALELLSTGIKPGSIPSLLRSFITKIQKDTARLAISSNGTGAGRLQAIGDEDKKEDAAGKAGVACLIFPRRRQSEIQDQEQINNAPSEPAKSPMTAQSELLRASGGLTVRRYRHVWGIILDIGDLWHWKWFTLNVTALLLFFAWPHLFQNATIVSGRAEMAGREFLTTEHHLSGEAQGLDVLTFRVKANRYWPPLQFQVEAAYGADGSETSLFAAEGDFYGTLSARVRPDGSVALRYWRCRAPPAGLPDTPVVSVRNFHGRLLDRKFLFLTAGD